MKTKTILVSLLIGGFISYSCQKPENSHSDSNNFQYQAKLDSLISGQKDLGDKEINAALIRQLQYQKKMKVGETNGVVIPKSLLTQSINGFTELGIVLPKDTSNFSKWDFLVIYPGLEINSEKEEKLEPVVFYYKGGLNSSGELTPIGIPVNGLKFLGGGGGDGVKPKPSPPPTVP